MKRFALLMIVSLGVVFSNLSDSYAQGPTARDLHQAIVDGNLDQVKSLLSKGIDINAKNNLGGTPLHNAISHSHEAIAEFIISKGPDLNARDNQGQTPLFMAIQTKQRKIVDLLLAKNVDVNVVARGGQNALTLARSNGDTELMDILVKRGATEPVLDMEGDMYPGMRRGAPGGVSPTAPVQPVARPTTEPSVLSDPNEIKARVKTFAGLEKSIQDITVKSDTEERQWRQTRYDNRSLLSRAVQSQFEEELGLVKKVAVEEKAKKTVAAIDALITQKQERSKVVSRELLQQRREQEQAQSTRGRSRGRTSAGGRATTGRSSQRGGQYGNDMSDSLYGGAGGMDTMGRPERPGRPAEQLDPQTEDEIRRWTQAAPDKKGDLAKTVHEQIMAEIGFVRTVAVEEQAKKTTATIDGLMLARKERYDQLVLKMQEDEMKAQERQTQMTDPRGRGRGNTPGQWQGGDSMQQQDTQQRGRTRRR